MAGVEESGAQAGREVDGAAIVGDAAETVEDVDRVEQRIERRAAPSPARPGARRAKRPAMLFLLQMGGVEQHQPRQFAGRGGGDDLALKAALDEQRQAPAMVEMGVGQQDENVDGRGIEAEVVGVLLLERAAALIERRNRPGSCGPPPRARWQEPVTPRSAP